MDKIKGKTRINYLMTEAIRRRVSDLHLIVDSPPYIRLQGKLHSLPEESPLKEAEIETMVFSLCSQAQKEVIITNKELDFSYNFQDRVRFRINAYYQKDTLAAALRLVPDKIKEIDDLFLPSICHQIIKSKQGLVLITGPTGHGKSTTIASMINEINHTQAVHIVTIEDPIEFTFKPEKAIISQRELRKDTHSWLLSLRSVLREDPNVVFVGEMRDLETIKAALTIAETGHLVFSTLHTNSAAQTIDRIVDVFPRGNRDQIRLQFSNVLLGVISQRLVPTFSGERRPAVEVMLGSTAIKTVIREGKSHMIDNIIQTSREIGMISLENSLASLISEGQVSLEVAQKYALRPQDLLRMTGKGKR